MSDEAVQRWLSDPWTPEQRGVLAAAEALACAANRRRRWRRKLSPLEFIPAARNVVVGMRANGLEIREADRD